MRQARVLVRRGDQSLHDGTVRAGVLSLQRFKLIFEPRAGSQTDDRRQVEREHQGRAYLLHRAEGPPDHRLHRVRGPYAISERFQPRHEECGVGFLGAIQQ